ncbi:MAG: hypothetical protein GY826_12605 [Fuerstiella sp.]|nr:hypothetical protein [Fuerstiella sp.]
MFHVISCRKFTRQTLRIVNATNVEEMLDGDMGECLLCGICSHVELGPRRDYWTIHSSHETELQATAAAWAKLDREGLDELQYDMTYLPPQPEPAKA